MCLTGFILSTVTFGPQVVYKFNCYLGHFLNHDKKIMYKRQMLKKYSTSICLLDMPIRDFRNGKHLNIQTVWDDRSMHVHMFTILVPYRSHRRGL